MFSKTYKKEDLLCPWDGVLDRIKRIEKFSSKFPVETRFTIVRDTITRESTKSPGFPANYGELNYRQKSSMAKSLDSAYSLGLVHGDINKKNVIFTSNICHILDWEPSLFQIRRGRPSWMVTNPWVDKTDLMNRKIGPNTDFLGFWNFLENPGAKFFNSDSWVKIAQDAMFEERPFRFLLKMHLSV